MNDTRNETEPEKDGRPTHEPLLDDDTFVRLMEESFAREQSGRDAKSTEDGELERRVWERLQARIASEPSTEGAPRSSSSKEEGRPRPTAGVGVSQVGRGTLFQRVGLPLVSLIGLAAAAILFLRVGSPQGEDDPTDPSNLKGANEPVSQISFEVNVDATGTLSFSVRNPSPEERLGAVFFAPRDAVSGSLSEPATLLARGSFAVPSQDAQRPQGSEGEWAPLQGEGQTPVRVSLPAGKAPGRICLFLASTQEGLDSLIRLAPTVFERHSESLCKDLP